MNMNFSYNNSLNRGRRHYKFLRSKHSFSLVEVVIALGVVAFALIPIMGLLPSGLASSQASTNQTVTANIAQQIRGELQQVSFNSTNAFYIQNLLTSNYYYTLDGIQTTNGDANAYYVAGFSLAATPIPGGASGSNSNYDTNNAGETVTVTLSYPYSAANPASAPKSVVFSLLEAKQSNE